MENLDTGAGLEHSPGHPLCVDLDGTLVRSDLLLEALILLLKGSPLLLFVLPFWLLQGRARFKERVAERVVMDVSLLPYHTEFLAFLREQHASGRSLVLATAANIRHAEAVAEHLGIFDQIIASDDRDNLKGPRKAARLVERFGHAGFDYAANGKVDVAVWEKARCAILVRPERGVAAAITGKIPIERIFEGNRRPAWRPCLKALRPHQWLKNLLVFVPLAMAHRHTDTTLLGQAVLAFLSFSSCASSVYLLNDLLDLAADRQHHSKHSRPLASGTLPIAHALLLIPLLLLAAVLFAGLLPPMFLGILGLYFASTLAYSLRLKGISLVDVLVLAGLYSLRLVAGGAAVQVPLSFWLLAFSMFLFLSLALVKRYTELQSTIRQGRKEIRGRGYLPGDSEIISQFGTASGYLSVLVLAFYINSENVIGLYSHPQVIWMLCPLLLYLISRIWLLARREELHEDPVVFMMEDRQSQAVLLVCLALLVLAA